MSHKKSNDLLWLGIGLFGLAIAVILIIIIFVYISPVAPTKDPDEELPNSFDLFDTLVARRYISEKNNMSLLGDSTFYSDRKRAEKESPNPVLHSIYDYLSKNKSESKSESESKSKNIITAQKEIDNEISNLISVRDNLRKVKKGDYIITDTYYDEETIRKIIREVCRLDPDDYKLIVSYDGKKTGIIWRAIGRHINKHIGENWISGGQLSSYSTISPRITNKSTNLSRVEFYCNRISPHLCFFIRELRLRCKYPSRTFEGASYMDQLCYNFPILIIFSVYLNRWCKEKNVNKIRGMLRDCCIFNQLFPYLYSDYDYDMIYSSRISLTKANEMTTAYFKAESSPPESTVWIDFNGSGKSFVNFFTSHQIPMCYNMNILRNHNLQKLYPKHLYKFYSDNGKGNLIEALNLSPEGRFSNLDSNGDPIQLPLEYPKILAEVPHRMFVEIRDEFLEWNTTHGLPTSTKGNSILAELEKRSTRDLLDCFIDIFTELRVNENQLNKMKAFI